MMTENGCSEDLPCSQQRIPSARFAGSCFCGRPNERRTARRTTIGALSRTSAWQAGVSYSATFCTWARSTPRRRQGGERPSRFSTTMRGFRGHWRCSPKIDVLRWRPTRRSFSFACRTCGCVGRGNGAPVGWPGSCGGICGWSSSGPSACRRTARVAALGSGLACAGLVSIDRTGQRVEVAPRLVRQERHGRPVGGGLRTGGGAQAVPPVTTFCCSTKTRYSHI